MFYWNTESSAPKKLHPSLSWSNWKDGKFMYWDRDAQEELVMELPKEFVVIADSWSIKWRLESKGWVWSNEVYSFANDPFTVKDKEWHTLYSWLWKDIKQDIKAVRLGLTKNIHYFDPAKPDEIRTVCIKGSWLKAWMDVFKDDLRNAPAFKRIKLDKVDEGKVGSVKFTFPVFAPASDLTADDRINQQKLWAELMNYKNSVQADAEVEEVNSQLNSELKGDEELPF